LPAANGLTDKVLIDSTVAIVILIVAVRIRIAIAGIA